MSHNQSREESRKHYEQQQHLKLMRREEELIRIEQEKLSKGQLTKQEIEKLRNREELLKGQRKLHQLDDTKGQQLSYQFLGNDTRGYLDVARQDELLQQREDTTLDYKGNMRNDQNWNNDHLQDVLANQNINTTPAVNTKDVFNMINLIMHEKSKINGDDGTELISLEGLSEEDKKNILDARKEKEELSKLSEFEQIQYKRRKLPAYLYREQLLEQVDKNQVLIIEGETGSGKTTQIMQYLYEAGYCNNNKIVACTQPRRVAATSVAARVAVEKGVELGQEVGYNVRFDNCTSDKTCIKYLTDGMLLRELLTDPDLKNYSVIMIDEAHERTISTDILLGILKPLLVKRQDLKLLIASATINIEKFSTFFNHAPTFKIPGRTCNIDIYYTQNAEADYVEAAIITIMQIHSSQPLNGDVLVFLPGQEEIQTTNDILLEKYTQTLKKDPNMPTLMICPIYANLPAEEQAKIFHPTPPNTRKVVLATNIAETSLTIDGIVYVIDCGWCKTKLANSSGNAGIGMEALVTTPISKASANQRAGRAGRIRDGKCFRLYTYDTYIDLDDQNIPEIQRSNLCNVILLLKSLGINRFVDFDWIDPPSVQALNQSLSLLYALGAIAADGRLTKVGYTMTILPVDPMVAKMLIKSQMYKTTHDCIKIAALLSAGGSVLYQPNNKNVLQVQQAAKAHHTFFHPHGDHFTLANVYNEYLEQIEHQRTVQRELEDSMVLYPSLQKQQELLKVKRHVQQWCMENYLQYKMLQRVEDIVAQLYKVCTDVNIPVQQFDNEHKEKLKQFGMIGNNTNDNNNAKENNNPEYIAYITDYEKRLRLSILHGFFPNIAKYTGGGTQGSGKKSSSSSNNQGGTSYSLLKNLSQQVYIHPQSCLYRPTGKELRDRQRREERAAATLDPMGNNTNNNVILSQADTDKNTPPPAYVLYHELMQTKKEYLRGCMVIERDWIGVVAPHFYPDEARMLMSAQNQPKKR